ncbi:hypothetical protein HHI36_012653 [Cryptolaemus montrouzieri]|uniref:Uncharacterized protein n=1 Tax=Cryptolaemus montrouzieri TaxID=559131 RepID=A0ABD2NG21_9CUCU
MAAGDPDEKPNAATKSCRNCGIILKSGMKYILCGSLNHPGCIKNIKHIRLADAEVICCKMTEKKIDLDDLENVEPTAETEMDTSNYIIEINHLKSIIKCKNDIIGELKENNQLLKDKIHLMKKKHPTNHGKYKSSNTTEDSQQQGRQVGNDAKKSATQRHVDNNDIDQLIHDLESDGDVKEIGSDSQQENKTTTKESE